MKTCITACILFVIMSIEVCLQESKAMADDNPIQSDVTRIYQKLVDEEIGQIEILHIPAWVETPIRLAPEGLQKEFDYRLTIRSIPHGPFEKGLVEALKTFKAQPASQGTDLRWGIVFFDNDMQRIGAIYFGRVGSRGVIGNTDMSCNSTLFDWLVSNFSCCFGEANSGAKKKTAKTPTSSNKE